MIFRLQVVVLLSLSWLPRLEAADGGVTGQLTDPQGKPIAGATLRLKAGENSNPLETASDSRGRFVFSALAEGTYQLTATAA